MNVPMTDDARALWLKRRAEGLSRSDKYVSTGLAVLEWAALKPAEAMGFTHRWINTTTQAPHFKHGAVIRTKLIETLADDYPLAAAAAIKICDGKATRPALAEPSIQMHRLEAAAYSLINRARRMTRIDDQKRDTIETWSCDFNRLNSDNSEMGRDVAMATRIVAALTGTAGSELDRYAEAALAKSQRQPLGGAMPVHPCKPRLPTPV